MLDRFDLRVRLRAVKASELFDEGPRETSTEVRARVIGARARSRERSPRRTVNADLTDGLARVVAKLGPAELAFYRRLVESASLSARGATRLLRVSRTIADLEGADRVTEIHCRKPWRSGCRKTRPPKGCQAGVIRDGGSG